MKHIKTEVHFEDKEGIWVVKYSPMGGGMVYLNDEQFGFFRESDSTKTKHPTKTKSLELIRIVKKRNKKK